MKALSKAIIAAGLIGASSAQAYTISADATVGRSFLDLKGREAGAESKAMKSMEYTVAGHVQPMEELPFSVGLRAGFTMQDKNDLKVLPEDKVESAAGWAISPEAIAWVPAELLGTVGEYATPYARAGFQLEALGARNYKINGTQRSAKTQGFNIGMGLNVKATENVSAILDYSYTQLSYQEKTEGQKLDKSDLSSHTILVGAKFSV
ncbi:MAG: outer membrane beta-barrel protein [Deltaproteobacteria bacterium]|nr:outer membrane beta-barrel protein [Deltaproteobacteria bacterium]